jgi:hypothetical protein
MVGPNAHLKQEASSMLIQYINDEYAGKPLMNVAADLREHTLLIKGQGYQFEIDGERK